MLAASPKLWWLMLSVVRMKEPGGTPFIVQGASLHLRGLLAKATVPAIFASHLFLCVFFVKVKIFGFLMVSKKRVFCKSEEV